MTVRDLLLHLRTCYGLKVSAISLGVGMLWADFRESLKGRIDERCVKVRADGLMCCSDLLKDNSPILIRLDYLVRDRLPAYTTAGVQVKLDLLGDDDELEEVCDIACTTILSTADTGF